MSTSTRFGGMGGYPLRPVGEPVPERAVSATSVVEMAAEPNHEREIRIDASGVVTAEGPTEDHFTEALSYGARLGALVGDLLGLEQLFSIDLQFKNKRWGMVVTSNGDVVAKQISNADDFKRFKGRYGL